MFWSLNLFCTKELEKQTTRLHEILMSSANLEHGISPYICITYFQIKL